MSRSLTTLILGAGCSLDYGYPSGIGLVDLVREDLDEQLTLEMNMKRDLENNRPYSIDDFLKNFRQYDQIAKAIIAQILFKAEDPGIKRKREDFYQYLFHSIPREEYSEFQIITFNYDRSLEYFWAKHLEPHVGSAELAYQERSKLKIHHIHGRLSQLPGEKDAPSFGRQNEIIAYGGSKDRPLKFRGGHLSDYDPNDNELSEREVREREFWQRSATQSWDIGCTQYASSNIKTVHDNAEVDRIAEGMLTVSDRIFFLGFGYHPLNMKRLGHDWTAAKGKTIAGTCYDVPKVDLARFKRDYPAIKLFESTAYDFFRQHQSLDDPTLNL